MNYRIFIFPLLVLFFSMYACDTASKPEESFDPSLEKMVDNLVQPYIDSVQIAGLAIGVARNDTVILLKSYGYADLVFETPLPISASFEIGSITKQFTAVAVLQLDEKGLLDLEDDITEYLDFDTKGRKVTIEQLLNHTSGIKGYTEMPSFGDYAYFEYPRDTLLRIVEQEEFDFEPGNAMIYNNTGYFMLGLIIEKATGMSYEEYLVENIFSVAGMENSYYCDERVVRKNKAYGYDTGEEGLLKAGYLDHTWPYAAGSLCSSVEDLLQWNHILHETDQLLERKSYEYLVSPSKLNNGIDLRYTKGLIVDNYKGIVVITHGGGINGFLSDACYFPDYGLTIVTLINSTGPVSPTRISNRVADHLLPVQEIEYSEKYPGDLSAFTGKYRGRSRGRDMEVIVDAGEEVLTIEIYGEKDTLDYTGHEKWALGNSFISFVEEDGKISELHYDVGSGYYILMKQGE